MPGTRAYVKVREMGKFAALETQRRDALIREPDELMETREAISPEILRAVDQVLLMPETQCT